MCTAFVINDISLESSIKVIYREIKVSGRHHDLTDHFDITRFLYLQ
jgi:hypothetical protein